MPAVQEDLPWACGRGPTVLPVNYHVDGGTIVYRTSSGSATALAAGSEVAFEVDHVDDNPRGHPGDKVTTMTITPPGERHSVKINWPSVELATGSLRIALSRKVLLLNPVRRGTSGIEGHDAAPRRWTT